MVLEKPDKFRPPSHPQRLNRRPPRAYNQGLTPTEREVQKTKRYPHTFPNEGTVLYRFLTNRAIHLWITLVGVLYPLHWAGAWAHPTRAVFKV